ncbi:MAG: hypothetical protein WBR26_06290 [Candidatus Acidiferrum sp.]
MVAKICCDPGSGGAAQTTANFLYGGHQREGEKHGPKHAHAKLTAHLRVGADPARIVVSRSSYETRSQTKKKIAALSFGCGLSERLRRG